MISTDPGSGQDTGGGGVGADFFGAFLGAFGGSALGGKQGLGGASIRGAFQGLQKLFALQLRQSLVANRMALVGTPFQRVLIPTPKQMRREHRLQFKRDRAYGVGDALSRKERQVAKATAKQEKALGKLAGQIETSGAGTLVTTRYGLNNPLLRGSRDDPRGVIRPSRPSWWGHSGFERVIRKPSVTRRRQPIARYVVRRGQLAQLL